MEYLDDDPFTPESSEVERARRRRRTGGGGRRTRQEPPHSGNPRDLFGRRLMALGIGALIIILVVLGVRGCLNARKERSFENYASDLGAILTNTKQLSTEFFSNQLQGTKTSSQLNFTAQVAADRGTAEDLLTRVQDLSAPGELSSAQNELVLAFEIRRDAFGDIAKNISTALGKSSKDAVDAITQDMQAFLASDVLFARARKAILAELANQDIGLQPNELPATTFLPDDPTMWLDPLQIGGILAEVAGGTGAAGDGIHGLALLQTTINPGGVLLTPDTPATVSATGAAQLEVQVQNQGDTDETDVNVSYDLSGGTASSGDVTIPKIAAGDTGTAKLPIDPAPDQDVQLAIKVTVQPVPGEAVEDNNQSTYVVTFSGA